MVWYPRQRRMVGGVAVLALLLQLFLAPPLSLRMLAPPVALGMLALDAPVCGDVAPAPGKLLHTHTQCLLCQGHAVPLELAAVGLAIVLSVAVLACPRRVRADRGASCEHAGYLARAPPRVLS